MSLYDAEMEAGKSDCIWSDDLLDMMEIFQFRLIAIYIQCYAIIRAALYYNRKYNDEVILTFTVIC